MNSIFEKLDIEIKKSEYILDLKENFDGEGSVSYTYDVWKKATEFTKRLFEYYYSVYGDTPSIPKIYHGPNNTIDIFWTNRMFDLLINVPEVGMASFSYDEMKTKNHSDGSFNVDHSDYKLLPNIIQEL